MEGLIPEAYAPFARSIFASFSQPAVVTTESDVAEAVWRAANDASGQLRFPAGADAVALAQRSWKMSATSNWNDCIWAGGCPMQSIPGLDPVRTVATVRYGEGQCGNSHALERKQALARQLKRLQWLPPIRVCEVKCD